MDRRQLGSRAEQAVAAWLVERGFTILQVNARFQRGEIDLITERDGCLWFVESKCRSRSDVGPPHRAVDHRKRRALWAAAREYLYRCGHRGDFGFLVASVILEPGGSAPIISVARLPVRPSFS